MYSFLKNLAECRQNRDRSVVWCICPVPWLKQGCNFRTFPQFRKLPVLIDRFSNLVTDSAIVWAEFLSNLALILSKPIALFCLQSESCWSTNDSSCSANWNWDFGKSVLELQLGQVVVILSASRLPTDAKKLFIVEAIDLGVVCWIPSIRNYALDTFWGRVAITNFIDRIPNCFLRIPFGILKQVTVILHLGRFN